MIQSPEPKLNIQKVDDKLHIEWRWSRLSGILIIIGAIVFGAVILFVMQLPTSKGMPRDPSNILGLWIVGIVCVTCLTLFGVLHFVSSTLILASKDEVVCRAMPFALWKVKRIPASQIESFVVDNSASKRIPGQICVVDNNSQSTLVVFRAPSNESSKQICHELQDFYGLEDLPVYGQNTQPHQPGPRTQKH